VSAACSKKKKSGLAGSGGVPRGRIDEDVPVIKGGTEDPALGPSPAGHSQHITTTQPTCPHAETRRSGECLSCFVHVFFPKHVLVFFRCFCYFSSGESSCLVQIYES
jgi:hypothetical protein